MTRNANDLKAVDNFRILFLGVSYHLDLYKTARDADAVIILTEWNEYRSIDLEQLKSVMKGRVITRNLLEPQAAQELGFQYQGVGR
jgi:UDPglucose 6-dehydrogenase